MHHLYKAHLGSHWKYHGHQTRHVFPFEKVVVGGRVGGQVLLLLGDVFLIESTNVGLMLAKLLLLGDVFF